MRTNAARCCARVADPAVIARHHGLEQLPAFGGQYFPKQVDRCEGDVRAAALAGEGIEGTLLYRFSISDRKRHGLHYLLTDGAVLLYASTGARRLEKCA